jgi:hypothetical protein
MSIPPESIEVGKCYVTAKGRARRVIAIEAGKVTFYEGQQVALRGTWPRRMVATYATFAANAVREVPCPSRLSQPFGSIT